LRRRGGGRIINISSTAAITGAVMSGAHYAASKAGVLGLTKQLAKELATDKILVNAITPGFIETDMLRSMPQDQLQRLLPTIPLGRIGTSEEVGHVVLFLASEDSGYMTGTVLNVSAGQVMQ
jgi:NAD(P)-dependent dehydrogenase (short-subunit alcohol dehydrogenase family)